MIRRLILSFNLEKYKRNEFVYKQGDAADNVYIVAKGEFLVTRREQIRIPARKQEN